MSKVLARSLVGLTLALATATVAANPATGPNATLTSVTGKVSVNQGREFVPAQTEMRLKPGDRIMIADSASATITFDDSCRMDLGESKVVTVPAKSTCAGAEVSQQGIVQGAGGGGAGEAVGASGTHNNRGVWIMVGGVLILDAIAISEGQDDTTSP
jgi:hypothetical protein